VHPCRQISVYTYTVSFAGITPTHPRHAPLTSCGSVLLRSMNILPPPHPSCAFALPVTVCSVQAKALRGDTPHHTTPHPSCKLRGGDKWSVHHAAICGTGRLTISETVTHRSHPQVLTDDAHTADLSGLNGIGEWGSLLRGWHGGYQR
jgi:hypothetical protein